ncbi:hypothetical protein PPERSA_05093 [Pseudocohnilembus persalinus]|uniref:Uncharacterized protein n=1 Tax=Pseudocohnilembus persalinus TaxID=266149 RepID=A0A0V0QWU5_PSEPJ|nr:hypothetical protein PPERSA_05093 [Pseudocohnilembus persalinus]|eukprot:KRX06480.1 hypothetical protein PPERSA_05093 [Pseudocohnilembus persalinus]
MFNTEYSQIIKDFIQKNSNNNNNNIIKIQKKQQILQNKTENSNKNTTEPFFSDPHSEFLGQNTELFTQNSENFPNLSNKAFSSFQFQTSVLDNKQSSFFNLGNHRKSSFDLDFPNFTQQLEFQPEMEFNPQNSQFQQIQQQNIQNSSFFEDKQPFQNEENQIFEEEIDFFNFNKNNHENNSSSTNDFELNSNQIDFSMSTPSQQPFNFSEKNAKQQEKSEKFDFLDSIGECFGTGPSIKNSQKQTQPFKIVMKSRKIQKQEKKSKDEQKKNSKNYDKNICKYLTRTTIRAFYSLKYVDQVMEFCSQNEDLYSDATQYFIRNLEKISGLRVLKQYLNYEQEPDPEIQEYKKIFKNFYKWFLKNRITRYILKGKMDNKEMYIQYKNNVMLKYSENLEKWNCNKFQQLQ